MSICNFTQKEFCTDPQPQTVHKIPQFRVNKEKPLLEVWMVNPDATELRLVVPPSTPFNVGMRAPRSDGPAHGKRSAGRRHTIDMLIVLVHKIVISDM